MKVLVIGANGQIGKHLITLLQESDVHSAVAMVRKDEQAKELEKNGVATVLANLEGTVDELAQAMSGVDAIVFTAGSGGKTGPDKTLLVDLDGAAKSIEAAEKAGVDRFLMVSAIQAHNRENWNEAIKPYFVAKHYADKILVSSNLNYTVVRPGGLVNEQGTGKVTVAKDLDRGFIPREDVAKVLLASLEEEATYRRSFDLVGGDTPVVEAVKSL